MPLKQSIRQEMLACFRCLGENIPTKTYDPRSLNLF
jgi:hypothetical protein